MHDFLRTGELSEKDFYCKCNEKYFTSSAVACEEKKFKGAIYIHKERTSWRERTKKSNKSLKPLK